MAQAFGPAAFQAMEEQVRTDMGFFREAMRLFSPSAPGGAGRRGTASSGRAQFPQSAVGRHAGKARLPNASEIDHLRHRDLTGRSRFP